MDLSSLGVRVSLMLGLAVLACGGSSKPGGSAPRTVTISAVATQLAEDGTTTADVPLPIGTPTVRLDDGSTPAVTQTAAGKWTAQVPSGPYWVVARNVAYRASGDTLDLGYVTTTRAFAAPPAASTPVSLTLTGLQSWASGDQLQLFSWGADSWDGFDPKLTPGTTNATVMEDWSTPNFGHGALNLLTPADRLYVIQYSTTQQAPSGRTYQRVVATTSITGVSMTDGQAVTQTPPAMVAPPDAATVSADWRTSQYEAALTTPAQPHGHELTVFAQIPGPGGEFASAVSPNLLDYYPPLSGSGTPDQQISAMVYGRFLPAQYNDVLYTGWFGTVSRGSPISGSTVSFDAYVVRFDPMTAIPSPLTPIVSGVRAVQIAGKDAGSPQTGVGVTPVVSWTPPAVGTPSRYVVQLYQFAGSGVQLVTTLNVPGSATSVQIPAGLQQAGQAYFLWISAQAGIGSDTAPLRAHLPTGAAVYATQTYVP